MYKTMNRIIKIIVVVILSALALVVLHYVRMALVCDAFVVNGVSMEPVLHSGDIVVVNKLLMGARIYKDYDFSKSSMSSFRLPGFSKVRRFGCGKLSLCAVAGYDIVQDKLCVSETMLRSTW